MTQHALTDFDTEQPEGGDTMDRDAELTCPDDGTDLHGFGWAHKVSYWECPYCGERWEGPDA